MSRLFPFPFRRRSDAPASTPLLTLQERRLLLGILFLFALGLAARALQLRNDRASSAPLSAQSSHPSQQSQ